MSHQGNATEVEKNSVDKEKSSADKTESLKRPVSEVSVIPALLCIYLAFGGILLINIDTIRIKIFQTRFILRNIN